MQIVKSPGSIKRLVKAAGQYQRTFRTPMDRLPDFVEALLSPHMPLTAASLTIAAWVFQPRTLEALLAKHGLPQEYTQDRTITASGRQEIGDLLKASLSDWLDFYFFPTPKRFLIYADHDEYTTVFGATKGSVSRTATSLAGNGFVEVKDYTRSLGGRGAT
jgi:hypothetical protein